MSSDDGLDPERIRKTLKLHFDLFDEAFLKAKALMVKHGFGEDHPFVPELASRILGDFEGLIGFLTQAPRDHISSRLGGEEDLVRELRMLRTKEPK